MTCLHPCFPKSSMGPVAQGLPHSLTPTHTPGLALSLLNVPRKEKTLSTGNLKPNINPSHAMSSDLHKNTANEGAAGLFYRGTPPLHHSPNLSSVTLGYALAPREAGSGPYLIFLRRCQQGPTQHGRSGSYKGGWDLSSLCTCWWGGSRRA